MDLPGPPYVKVDIERGDVIVFASADPSSSKDPTTWDAMIIAAVRYTELKRDQDEKVETGVYPDEEPVGNAPSGPQS